jgi:glycerol-3-phosphate dehydrogenase
MRSAWTRRVTLPGGDIEVQSFDKWADNIGRRYGFLDARLVHRLCRAYGTRVDILLSGISSPADLGRDLGAGLTEREVDYLMANEFAETAEDILWRRSKLGLRLGAAEQAALSRYIETASPRPAQTARASWVR